MLPEFNQEDNHHYYMLLLRLKENGEKFSWNDITYDELRFLSWEVNMPDSWIADLYDVNKSSVSRKRSKWNLQLRNIGLFEVFFGKTWYSNRDKAPYSLDFLSVIDDFVSIPPRILAKLSTMEHKLRKNYILNYLCKKKKEEEFNMEKMVSLLKKAGVDNKVILSILGPEAENFLPN